MAELTVVILEDLQVAAPRAEEEDEEEEGVIAKTCPKITQLDLSRNLFERLDPVLDICRELPNLQHLSIKCVPSPVCRKQQTKQCTDTVPVETGSRMSWTIKPRA